jgi:hypothetical protein
MSTAPDFSPLANVMPEAQSVLCFIHPQATYDAVAAALAFCMAAREAGKSCEVICEEPMRVEYNYLVNIDQVGHEAGNRDLVISFDYNDEQVDKVSYNINDESKRFELIVSPKSGAQPLDPQTVQFSRAGLAADVILLFGYHAFDELGAIYEKEKYAIERAYTVAFTQSKITPFAKLHLAMRADAYSYSEMVYYLVRQLQLGKMNEDIATNLLSGVEYATERFMQPNLPARVFETVAQLMRAGGKRQPQNPAFAQLNMPIRRSNDDMNFGGGMQGGQEMEFSAPQNFGQPMQPAMPQMPAMQGQVMPVQPQPMNASQSQTVSAADFAKAMGQRNN